VSVIAADSQSQKPEEDFKITLPLCIEEDFAAASPKAFAKKLSIAKMALHSQRRDGAPATLELWTDFDETVSRTIAKHGERTKSTWEILHPTLPRHLQAESSADRRTCLALQDQGALTIQAMNAWTLRELSRLKQALAEDVKKQSDNIILRSGAQDLFGFCAKHDIRTLIVSAGITEVIQYVTTKHGITTSGIVANALYDGKWDSPAQGIDGLVNTQNKRVQAEARFPARAGERRCIVVLGDNLHDSLMAQDNSDDIVIRIRTADKQGNTEAYLKESFGIIVAKNENGIEEKYPGFDLVLREQGLEVVTTLLKYLTDRIA